MLKTHNPPTIMAPAGAYSHGISVPPGARLLFIAGQVGTDVSGRTGQTILEQAQIAWANLRAVLNEAGMGVENLVKITVFYTADVEMNDGLRAALNSLRIAVLGQHWPASTAVFVSRLMRPEWKIEIEAVAAR